MVINPLWRGNTIIYGPNASGKTSIIGAMDVLRSIVFCGNIRNVEESKSPNHVAATLELIPNKDLIESTPIEFYIDFLVKDMRIVYKLVIDVGRFLRKRLFM